MQSNHLIPCRPLLLMPSIFTSNTVSSSESVLHFRWPKHWSFSFSNSSSNEDSGFISFRIDWLNLLAGQRTHKSLLQQHSSVQFSSVQSLSGVQLFVTPWIAARQNFLSITNSGSSLRPTPIESVIPCSHLILCRPLLLLPQASQH